MVFQRVSIDIGIMYQGLEARKLRSQLNYFLDTSDLEALEVLAARSHGLAILRHLAHVAITP